MRTVRKLKLESMTLHYESYGISRERATSRLLRFLGLNFTHRTEEFRRGEGYRDHFEPGEVEAVQDLAEELSDDGTWEILERYFD